MQAWVNVSFFSLQMNLANPEIYNILGKMYTRFYELFQFETFHMGADEVYET